MRRFLAAGIWLGLTVTATLIVWTAVSVVAADVTDRPAPVVGHRDVVVALSGASSGVATSTTTTTTLPGPASTAGPRPTSAAPPSSAASVAGRTATTVSGVRSSTPTGPAFGPSIATTVPPASAPPTTKPTTHSVVPTTSTTTPAVGGTATFSNDGGSLTVACTSFNTIRLVAALPNDSYWAVVTSSGPYYVQVNFVGKGTSLQITAACVFGQPFEGNQTPPTTTGP